MQEAVDNIEAFNAIAAGLEVTVDADAALACMTASILKRDELYFEWSLFRNATSSDDGTTSYIDDTGLTTYITSKNAYFELTKTLGESSDTFKTCYNDFDNSFYRFWLFIGHYESVGTYFINLLPNILAYALFFNQWTTRIQQLDALNE